jgi:hypothetical protein
MIFSVAKLFIFELLIYIGVIDGFNGIDCIEGIFMLANILANLDYI